ncbi:hypothetical protein K443DRAFT_253375 [Laccaria amethystina LaAM-08-1]|uniref:Unplaced genomic scaffold K443scaffold_160, whole genome shotgun sequence n=1 Tax=Laccaria amethystina LaAM-08-1 TaxID=1095629 RepID=A0A0C9XID0_9AGAR|nr:hypothetical protein K443DRAFT_253375 [Laccaria amethystina LaAM-08-1]
MHSNFGEEQNRKLIVIDTCTHGVQSSLQGFSHCAQSYVFRIFRPSQLWSPFGAHSLLHSERRSKFSMTGWKVNRPHVPLDEHKDTHTFETSRPNLLAHSLPPPSLPSLLPKWSATRSDSSTFNTNQCRERSYFYRTSKRCG